MGMADQGAEAAEIMRKGSRATADELARLDEIMLAANRESSNRGGGDIQNEMVQDMLNSLTPMMGPDSPLAAAITQSALAIKDAKEEEKKPDTKPELAAANPEEFALFNSIKDAITEQTAASVVIAGDLAAYLAKDNLTQAVTAGMQAIFTGAWFVADATWKASMLAKLGFGGGGPDIDIDGPDGDRDRNRRDRNNRNNRRGKFGKMWDGVKKAGNFVKDKGMKYGGKAVEFGAKHGGAALRTGGRFVAGALGGGAAAGGGLAATAGAAALPLAAAGLAGWEIGSIINDKINEQSPETADAIGGMLHGIVDSFGDDLLSNTADYWGNFFGFGGKTGDKADEISAKQVEVASKLDAAVKSIEPTKEEIKARKDQSEATNAKIGEYMGKLDDRFGEFATNVAEQIRIAKEQKELQAQSTEKLVEATVTAGKQPFGYNANR